MRDPYDIVGKTIDRRYAVRRVVAEGGFGVVYEAEAISLGVPVALKVLRVDMGTSPDVRARFEQEAKLLARLKHHAIVELTDAAQLEDGTPYLVLAWIEGETLDARIRRAGPLSPRQVVDLLAPVVSAIAYAHKAGVVHRDLKPANLMVGVDGRPRVLDFGVARWASDLGVQTTTTSKTGLSLGYAAPEQYGKEFGPIDGRADEFALAAIVYAALTGEPAFAGETATEVLFATCAKQERPSVTKVRNDVPAALDDVLQKAMSIKPVDRYATIDDFWTALTTAIDGAPATLQAAPSIAAIGSLPPQITLPSPDAIGATAPATVADAAIAPTERAPIGGSTPRSRAAVAHGLIDARTVRQGEAPPSSVDSEPRSGPRSRTFTLLAFVAAGGIAFGAIYAFTPWFSPGGPSKPNKQPWVAPSKTTYTPVPSPSPSADPVPPCGLDMGKDEICVFTGRLHRGPYDCSTAAKQIDHVTACPPEIRQVLTFAIDRTEVTLARWTECVTAGKCQPLTTATTDTPEMPARGMTWNDAKAFCAWDHGKRLPTDDEWELAAAGAGDAHRLFPWGNAQPSDKLAVFAVEAPKAVGILKDGATPEGIFDLAGNVAEWTSKEAPASTPAPNMKASGTLDDASATKRWVRGGSFTSDWDGLRTWTRDAFPETYFGPEIGLRCARTIPPAKK
jgi:serine/threonine protein kinase/formylglycine-generating enzyme required for sulfatase activity